MARIRSIKPEFWTDEALSECSTNARLLFIGTWTFADDSGNLERSARQLKAQVFPYDGIDCEPLLQELLRAGVLIEYEVQRKKFLHIKGFAAHQRVDRPGKPRVPLYEPSPSPHGVLGEDSTNPPRALATESSRVESSRVEGSREHTDAREAEPLPGSGPAHIPTPASAVCVLLRSMGMLDGHPDHPQLRALIAAGATIGEFESAGREAIGKGKGFAYALAVVRGQREAAARIAILPAAQDTRRWEPPADEAEYAQG